MTISKLVYTDKMDIQTITIINNLIDKINGLEVRLEGLEVNQDPSHYQRVWPYDHGVGHPVDPRKLTVMVSS